MGVALVALAGTAILLLGFAPFLAGAPPARAAASPARASLDLADPLLPVDVSSIPSPDATAIAASGQTLYIAADGIVTPFDLTNAAQPAVGTSVMRATAPQQMATIAGKLVIADTYEVRVYGPNTPPVPPPRSSHPRLVRP